MTRLYHITKESNLDNIMRNGIVPHLGKNAKDCGETKAAIWLFPDKTTMNDAIGSWFEDLLKTYQRKHLILIR